MGETLGTPDRNDLLEEIQETKDRIASIYRHLGALGTSFRVNGDPVVKSLAAGLTPVVERLNRELATIEESLAQAQESVWDPVEELRGR